MKDIITRHKSGEHIGICSVCSAHPLVIEAALRFDLSTNNKVLIEGHCCKVSDEAAFCLIQRPYISKTLLTRRISPRGSP